MAGEKVKFSFGFSKKVDQKHLTDSKFREESTKDIEQNPDFVLSVSGNNIKSSAPKLKKKELVIPLIVKNNWRLPSTTAGSNVKQENEVTSDLESQAVNAILQEAKRQRDGGVDGDDDDVDSEQIVPIFMQNRIPNGYETDERMDVTLRAEQSTLDDYERIPIEEYGFAMLKGMGWKEGEGIGAKNKRVVPPLEVNLRPKGLGLGADASAKQGLATKKEAEEAVNLVVGGYIKILSGIHKDAYGQVEGLDMDNARVMARLAITSSVVTVSEHAVRAVSKNEYKKEGKLLNKAKYEEYKAKSDAALEKKRSELHRLESKRDSSESATDSHKRSKQKHSKEKHRSRHDRESERSSERSIWVRPLLRVRFIEKSYKEGRYFNTKVIIEDVVNKNICICRTDDGRILEDIPGEWLETVIPRSEPPIIMIVRGDLRGQIGEILDKNKGKCIATVQLLQEKHVIQLEYDSICEYVGKIAEDY